MPYGSPWEQLKARIRYLKSICSPNLANVIVYDNTKTDVEKMEILKIAQEIAKKKGRFRVYLEDWSDALKIWEERRRKNEGISNNLG